MAMGITILVARPVSVGLIEVSFTSKNRGAANWQSIVDDFAEASARLAPHHAGSIRRLDGDKSLGRGGRLRMPVQAFAYLLADWEQSESVARAVDYESLVVDLLGVDKHALERARRRTASRPPPARTTGYEPYTAEDM
jgi:hypothetical protein